MINIIADVLAKKPPVKVHLPPALLMGIAPLIERMQHFPKGALKGLLESVNMNLVGDVLSIRTILLRQPLSYRDAVRKALHNGP